MGVFPKLALALAWARSGSNIPALAGVAIATAVLGVWRSGVSDAIDGQFGTRNVLGLVRCEEEGRVGSEVDNRSVAPADPYARAHACSSGTCSSG
jgi:hypothetical protein